MTVKTIESTPYIDLCELYDEDNNINGYYFVHEKRCNGQIICILPYCIHEMNIMYLLRYEKTPCWSTVENQISSITGGAESEKLIDDVQRELEEEAGYSVNENNFVYLGESFSAKSADTKIYYYTCCLNLHQRFEAEGDGSSLEKEAYCYWSYDVIHAVDPLVFTAYCKLHSYLNQ